MHVTTLFSNCVGISHSPSEFLKKSLSIVAWILQNQILKKRQLTNQCGLYLLILVKMLERTCFLSQGLESGEIEQEHSCLDKPDNYLLL
jgi:hypothetical protein